MYKKMLFGLASLIVFATLTMVLASCRVVDASTLNTGPALHMGNATFKAEAITIKKGEKLNLVDDVAVQHIITNGYWNGSNQVHKKEPGAPAINANITGGSQAVGPFTTAGTYRIYCTVHGGMEAKVVVS